MTFRVVKRSLTIAGHRTSVSLEEAFWGEMKSAAARRNISIAALVGAIDAERKEANLSSAIRVFILNEVRGATAPAETRDPAAG